MDAVLWVGQGMMGCVVRVPHCVLKAICTAGPHGSHSRFAGHAGELIPADTSMDQRPLGERLGERSAAEETGSICRRFFLRRRTLKRQKYINTNSTTGYASSIHNLNHFAHDTLQPSPIIAPTFQNECPRSQLNPLPVRQQL